eukprot:gene11698-56151_t
MLPPVVAVAAAAAAGNLTCVGCCTPPGGGFPIECCQYIIAPCPCKKCAGGEGAAPIVVYVDPVGGSDGADGGTAAAADSAAEGRMVTWRGRSAALSGGDGGGWRPAADPSLPSAVMAAPFVYSGVAQSWSDPTPHR